jgi:spore germination protein YaaH
MKRLALLILASLTLCPPVAMAEDRYYCTVSTTSPTASNSCLDETNSNAAKSIPKGGNIAINCDGTAYVAIFYSSATAVTATTGVPLTALQHFDQAIYGTSQPYVSALSSSGTVKCRVFLVLNTVRK